LLTVFSIPLNYCERATLFVKDSHGKSSDRVSDDAIYELLDIIYSEK